jgi:hypothetical protein
MGRPNTYSGARGTVDEILAHYGKKGMKWGVRKDSGHEGERAKTKKIEKLDTKFSSEASSLSTTIKIHNRAAQLTNANDVSRINNKPEYKNVDFNRDSPLRQKYYKEHQKAFLDNLEKSASELGSNASGTKSYGIREGEDGSWNVILKDVKHADEVLMRVKVNRDAKGHITSLEIEKPDVLAQGETIDGILAHYGVPGMRWGKRKPGTGTPSKRVASADHTEAKALKKKRPAELSNAELKKLNERMNLEQNYMRLMSNNPSKLRQGAQITSELLKLANQGYSAYNSPVVKEIKKALT